ncbi:methyltransferase domain-containing protein [Candidatus Hydrogenedentota bacterium]
MHLSDSQSKVKELFEELLDRYGDSHKSLAYGSVETQMKKFEMLAGVGDLDGCTLLDVGCGFGDLHKFIEEMGLSVRYTGIDISPRLIDKARKKYPEAEFMTGDIVSMDLEEESYDYVVGTGFNCFKTDHNWETISVAMDSMFQACREGVALQMLSTYAPRHDESSYYASPEEILHLALGYTTRIVLRHDYAPHDFTIYMYKNSPEGRK